MVLTGGNICIAARLLLIYQEGMSRQLLGPAAVMQAEPYIPHFLSRFSTRACRLWQA